MKRPLLLIAALTGTLILAGCDDAKEAEQANANSSQAEQGDTSNQQGQSEASATRTLEGVLEFSATDVPLPDDAEVLISLRDVSRADAPATTIAETTVTPGNEDPVEFSLDYDTADVTPKHTHGLRAALHGDEGELLWTTTSHHAVEVGPDAKQGPTTLVLEPVNTTPDGGSLQEAQQDMLQEEANNADAQTGTADSLDEVNEQATDMQEPAPEETSSTP